VYTHHHQTLDAVTTLQEYLLQALPDADSDTTARRHGAAAEVVSMCYADRAQAGVSETALYASFSRALWSVGDTADARLILASHVEQRAIRDTLLELLSLLETSALLWESVVRGVVRHRSDWLSTDQRPIWVLDTERLTSDLWQMELTWPPAIRRLIEELAPVWDKPFGHGVLGVVMPSRHAQPVLLYLRKLMQHVADQRNWTATPQVLRL